MRNLYLLEACHPAGLLNRWDGQMKRAILVLLLLFAPVAAQESVVLDFKFDMRVKEGKNTRHVEMNTKVLVKDGKPADIVIDSNTDHVVTLKVNPTLRPTGLIELGLTVDAMLGRSRLLRKMKLATLQGVPALVEVEDERTGEILKVEVLASKGPR